MKDGRISPKFKKPNKKGVRETASPRGDVLPSVSLPSFDMYRGYFPLWRKITDWGWYKEGNTTRVFIHLLLKANREQKDYLGYIIYQGQCVTGRKRLSVELGLSEQQIRTAFSHLKSTNEITIKTTNKFSIITLVNWEKYLPKNYLKVKKPTINQPSTNQQVTTTNKDKKEEKDKNNIGKNASPSAHRSTFSSNKQKIPPLINQVREYCKQRKNGVNPKRWWDFYQSKGWYVGMNKMRDWKAAIRTWEKKGREGRDSNAKYY